MFKPFDLILRKKIWYSQPPWEEKGFCQVDRIPAAAATRMEYRAGIGYVCARTSAEASIQFGSTLFETQCV